MLLLQPARHLCASTPPLIHTSPPRSLCSPPLPGSRDPGTSSPGEQLGHASGCCNIMPASATPGSPHLPYPSLFLAWMIQSPLISCSFNPLLSGRRTDARERPTCRGGAKSKAEPQELCEQRREREISPSSLRSSRLNLHNQLDVPCLRATPEETMNHPKVEVVDFGRNCRLGVCCMWLTSFWSLCLS